MTPIQFLPIFLDNIEAYYYALLLSCLIYIPVIYRLTYSIFDPFLFGLVGALFSHSMVIFLFFINYIDVGLLSYFLLSEYSLIIGMLLFSTSKDVFLKRTSNYYNISMIKNIGSCKILFFASLFFYLISTLLDYYLNGIPAFRVSRQGAYVGSGGLGVIDRVSYVSYITLSLSALIILKENTRNILSYKFFAWLAILVLIITVALSGSRSKIIIIFSAWFYVSFYYCARKTHLLRSVNYFGGVVGLSLMAFAIFISLVVIFLAGGDGQTLFAVFSTLLYRFVNFGDIFLYAYTNDGINNIQGDSVFIGLLGGFFSVFRLFPSSDLYQPIGYQLALSVDPNMFFFTGPNPRHNVFGFHFFSWGGIVFSFLCGVWLSWVRYRLYRIMGNSLVFFCLCCVVMDASYGIYTDFQYMMSNYASIIIVFSILLFIDFILPKCSKRVNKC